MPIYAYKCASCGFAKDVLQKLSDAPLTVCPSCGQAAFTKQLTAAGFQLKGSGWYVTDFRDGGKKGDGAGSNSSSGAAADGGGAKADGKSDSAAPAAAPAPAPSSGGGSDAGS